MDHIQTISPALPKHGRIACRNCFNQEGDLHVNVLGKWQMVNDPGAWGSAHPKILILGFSKGFTQANAYNTGRFEDIPFKDMRSRLTEELRALRVLSPCEIVDERMVATERDLAFGSLVRCSLSRINAKGRLECTGQVMPKAFKEEAAPYLRRCVETFLANLPESVRLILMLGTTHSYVEGCRTTIRSVYGPRFSDVNEVSYRTDRVIWTHISHPSGLNGHHPAWMAGDPATKPGRKRQLAMQAVNMSGAFVDATIK